MKIKSIVIELEPEHELEKLVATVLTFKDGMWNTNGPIWSRYHSAMHEVWKMLRQVTSSSNYQETK